MTFTNFGRQQVAFALGSDIANNFISSVGIGSGSGAVNVDNVTLIAEHTRTTITGSPDFSVTQKAGFQADFSSTQLSGLIVSEFGLFQSGATGTGSLWQREGFGSLTFDGTLELQIITTLEVF